MEPIDPHEECLNNGPMGNCGTSLMLRQDQKVVEPINLDRVYPEFRVTGSSGTTSWEFCQACADEYMRLIRVRDIPLITEDPL